MECTVHALKIWKHAYLDLSISERTKIDLQSKVQKAKVLFWKNFLPGGYSEYSLFPPGDQGVWGGRHIRGQRKIPLGHTVTTITLRIGHIAFLRWTIMIFTVARISLNPKLMLSIDMIPLGPGPMFVLPYRCCRLRAQWCEWIVSILLFIDCKKH